MIYTHTKIIRIKLGDKKVEDIVREIDEKVQEVKEILAVAEIQNIYLSDTEIQKRYSSK